MDLKKVIQQIIKGNQVAFKQLVEHYQSYAFRLAFKIVCNEEDARDVVQESFIKIWKNIRFYQPSIKFTTWMYKIVTNTAIDFYRSKKKRANYSFHDMEELISNMQTESADQKLNNHELAILFQNIASDLPEKQRLVFVLRDLQGIGSSEVQEILNLSADAVKSNLYHARKLVKEQLIKLNVYERR